MMQNSHIFLGDRKSESYQFKDDIVAIIPSKNSEDLIINERDFISNLLLIGGTRSGKSNFLLQLADQLLDRFPDSIFIFLDVKGEYIDHLIDYNKDIIISDSPIIGYPEEIYQYFKWSLLDEVCQGQYPEKELQEILKMCFQNRIENSNNRFFPEAAEEVVRGILETFLRNINKINVPMLSNHEWVSLLKRMDKKDFFNRLDIYSDHKSIQDNIPQDSKSAGQTHGVLSEVHHFLNETFPINSLYCSNGHDTIKNLFKSGGHKIFLEFDFSNRESNRAILTMLLNLILKYKLARNNMDNQRIIFFLDEFPALYKIDLMSPALNLGAAKRMNFITSIQSIAQVESIYKEEKNVILGAHGSEIAFRSYEEETVNHIINNIGEDYQTVLQLNPNRDEGLNMQIRRESLITSLMVKQLKVGEAFVTMANKPFQKIQFLKLK